MKKIELLRLLDKYGFTVVKSEVFMAYDSEYTYCYNVNSHIGLVVKEYTEYNYDLIISDVSTVRLLLRNNNINIWNTYYIILIDFNGNDNVLDNEIYRIERDPKGLRKYLLIIEEDINRIPYIKPILNSHSLNLTTDITSILHTEDEELDKLISWIISENGEYEEISKKKLQEHIEKLIIEKLII